MRKKNGFTLIEILVVMGIIATLAAVSIATTVGLTKRARRQHEIQLVGDVAAALGYIYQQSGLWPDTLVKAMEKTPAILDADACATPALFNALKLAKKHVGNDEFGNPQYKLVGSDRFGLVTPYATAVVKRSSKATRTTAVPTGGTIEDHTLRFAMDLDGDGITEVKMADKTVKVRAVVCVWSPGPDGKDQGYAALGKSDDVTSWRRDQEKRTR